MRKQRGRVRRDEILARSEPEDDRRPPLERVEDARLVRREEDEREHPLEGGRGLSDDLGEGGLRLGPLRRAEGLGDDLRVGLREEANALLLEPLLHRKEVLDDAVVNDDDAAGGVAMRVRVLLGGAAVRGPARVPDAEPAGRRVLRDLLREVAELALAARHAHDPVVPDDRDARRVVAAVLEALQAVEENRRRLAVPDVPDDAAHLRSSSRRSSSRGTSRRPRAGSSAARGRGRARPSGRPRSRSCPPR